MHRLPFLISRVSLVFLSARENKLRIQTRTKALLFALVRAFEFELAVKPEQIKIKGEIVRRPVSAETLKPEMPLIIKPYHGA